MVSQFSVSELVPHSDSMILLDSIESYSEHQLTASVNITESSMFAETAGVPAWVGVEYMGQAIAAMAGATARERAEPIRIGFLVSSRRYEPVVSHFTVGSSLTISVQAVTFNTTGLRVFECSIYSDGICLVTANLNVYMPEDVDAFIKENTQ